MDEASREEERTEDSVVESFLKDENAESLKEKSKKKTEGGKKTEEKKRRINGRTKGRRSARGQSFSSDYQRPVSDRSRRGYYATMPRERVHDDVSWNEEDPDRSRRFSERPLCSRIASPSFLGFDESFFDPRPANRVLHALPSNSR